MDITAIIVIALCVAFIIGGIILAKYGDVQSTKLNKQNMHNTPENEKMKHQKKKNVSGRQK